MQRFRKCLLNASHSPLSSLLGAGVHSGLGPLSCNIHSIGHYYDYRHIQTLGVINNIQAPIPTLRVHNAHPCYSRRCLLLALQASTCLENSPTSPTAHPLPFKQPLHLQQQSCSVFLAIADSSPPKPGTTYPVMHDWRRQVTHLP